MKRTSQILALLGFLLILGCHPFKELKPKPEVQPIESEYIEILNKDKKFELKQGKKYFMRFPAIQAPQHYLVLRVHHLEFLNSYLTRQFNQGKGNVIKLPDQSDPDDNLLVYEIDQTVPTFYWVIDEVRQDMLLEMQYRYVPIWRFRVESMNSQFQLTLARNSVDREIFESISSPGDLEQINVDRELQSLGKKTDALKGIQGEMIGIEGIFPPEVVNSSDPAYQDYQDLKNELEKELAFQDDYRVWLTALKKERESRGDDGAFLAAVPDFLTFFRHQDRYPENLVQATQALLEKRLNRSSSFLVNQLSSKADASPLPVNVKELRELYDESGLTPEKEFTDIANVIERFNTAARAVEEANSELDEIMNEIQSGSKWPSDNFYSEKSREVGNIKSDLPSISRSEFGKFSGYTAVRKLTAEVESVKQRATRMQRDFRRASDVVAKINRLRKDNDYSGIIGVLLSNKDLKFLMDQYPDLDQRSLNQQKNLISRALKKKSWATAERRLKALHQDRNFVNYSKISRRKQLAVKAYEDSLFRAIERESVKRIKEFIEVNKDNYQAVEAMYQDPVFNPVYEVSFSAGGPQVLAKRKKALQDKLNSYKFNQFPRTSIATLYQDFVQNFRKNGVAKAKAIITHGKFYQGNDKKIRNMIAEIDPEVPKVLDEPKNYRRIFVVPVNDTQKEKNEYLFRVNIQIPTDAQFPVWDVNIKLPMELAKSAANRQWYDKMTMNGKLLKNEGRFTITAPTRDNDYICLITPLQVNKHGDNILEVRFTYSAYKILEVSIMAQRPIIRKN